MNSESLLHSIANTPVKSGRMTAWWLGGSGFVVKNDCGATVYIDPYLSNSAEAIFGLQRAFPSPLAPEEASPDVVICTHWHEDHLDPGTIPVIARHSPSTCFVMPPSAASHAVSWGVPPGSIKHLTPGGKLDLAGFTIAHVPARHEAGIPGWETPDAMGLLLSTAQATLYHSGDTEYLAQIPRALPGSIDLATTCINGVTGNMNAHEAALLAWRIEASAVAPHHHVLWSTDPSNGQATLDPTLFERTYRRLGGEARVILPEVGRAIEI